MGLKGSVKALGLDELLGLVSTSGHSGTLNVFHKDARKTVYLHQGGLYLERSGWSFRIGDVLVRRGAITHEQLEAALAAQKASPRSRIGDLLVEQGAATREEIHAARRHQVQEELYEVFGWEDAFYGFERDTLPRDLDERLQDPEEFRFDVQSVLMESARRTDEWRRIRETLPSEKRLYALSDRPDAASRAAAALAEARGKAFPPEKVFSGRTAQSELPHQLGLSRFESLALLTRLIETGVVRPLARAEIESRLLEAMRTDLPQALKLYECALETPEFEARGRFLDRLLFGAPGLREASGLSFSARLRGRRALEVLMGLVRQGSTCELTAKEEGQTLRLGLSKDALVWRLPRGASPPDVLVHLLQKQQLPEPVLAKVRETQRTTGRTMRQVLVGGGYVTMDDWLRAQKDAVMDEAFNLLLLRRPYIEVEFGRPAPSGETGLDLDVPLLPWIQAEITRDMRHWETLLAAIPSPRIYLRLTPKGQRDLRGADDPFAQFDGRRPLDQVIHRQPRAPLRFLSEVHERLQGGRLEALAGEDYRALVESALAAGKRADALDACMAAIEAGVDVPTFRRRLVELRAVETEISVQATRPALKGDLSSISLAEIIQSLHLSKRTGTLRVEEAENNRAREIYLENGEVFILTGEHGLGDEDLLEKGLVAAGILTEEQLAKEAAQQLKDEVYEIFLWEKATFEYQADHLPPEFLSSGRYRKLRLNTGEFLLEAVRRMAQWESVRRVIPWDTMVLAFDSPEDKMQAVRTRGGQELLLLIDGRHPISDLVRISGMRRFRALTLLAELVRAGMLREVDVAARQEEEESAIVQTDLPTSGMIEEGFVGQLQFVGTLQEMASASLTGVLRVTDGRRSKELVLIDGVPHRTTAFRGAVPDGDDPREVASLDSARDVSECFSWNGARFELLAGTLPPRLRNPEQRDPLRLDAARFFDSFAEAGERWGKVRELIPRDKALAFTSDEAREQARARAAELPRLVDLVDGKNTAEDVARLSGARYTAMSWLVDLFEEGLVEPAETDGDDQEEWDLGM